MHAQGQHLRFTPEAARFLTLLQELGHVDDVSLMTLIERLGDDAPGEGSSLVGLDALRRASAALLFEQEGELDAEASRLLRSEWSALFG